MVKDFVVAGMDLRAVRRFHGHSPGMQSYRFQTIRQQEAEFGLSNHRTARLRPSEALRAKEGGRSLP